MGQGEWVEDLPVLPETELRAWDLFERGQREHLEPHQDMRCPCGSVYTRASERYLSCDSCHRVWEIESIDIDVHFIKWEALQFMSDLMKHDDRLDDLVFEEV